MRAHKGLAGWILAVILITGCATSMTPAYDPHYWRYGDESEKEGTASELGKCKVYVIGAYFWRDWMQIVSRPGPDGGSQLHATVKMWLGNSSMWGACSLSFRAVIIDGNGRSHPTTFRVPPNYRVLPDDVSKKWRALGEEARKDAIAKYNVVWDGTLKAGEGRIVELLASEGPYLPVGSRIHVEVTWTDRKGNSAVVRTLDETIRRTD